MTLRARDRQAELPRFAFLQSFEEMTAAKRDVTVIATNFRLGARNHGVTIRIDAKVHGRFAPALAHGL